MKVRTASFLYRNAMTLGLATALAAFAVPPASANPALGDPFLDDPFAEPADGLPESDGALYRVTGVEDDDVLNIRDIPGVPDSTIIGALAPDAVNVRLTGETATVNGATWLRVTSAALPGGSGWAHSAFLTAQDPQKTPDLGPEFRQPSTNGLVPLYTNIEGYEPLDAQTAQADWLEAAAGDDHEAFRQFNRVAPPTRALLLMRHHEGAPPQIRYRLRLGIEQVGDADTPGGPRPIAFLQVDALEMTPNGITEGPHVSYRMAMSPVQSRTADIVSLSRRDLPADQVSEMTCLGEPCDIPGPIADTAQPDWQDTDRMTTPEVPPYPTLTDDGVHSPEALLTMLAYDAFRQDGRSGWNWPETPEGVSFGAAFLEAVVDVNPGQEVATDVTLRNTALNDASTTEVWSRATSIAAPGDEPLLRTKTYTKPAPPMPAPE